MTIHPIVIAGEPVLHQPTREITEFDEKLRTLVDDMFETMYAAEGVGLAANQIGLDLRVFVYDCPDDDGVRHKGVVVNPKLETSEIPETMPDPDDDWEGCLSAPGESYPTGRAQWAKVTGSDIEGNPIEVEGTGYLARCLQHETDHLDGYIYLDRLVGRHARAAKKMLKHNKWGVPGNSWLPPKTPEDDGAVI
ncbi:peptide deformylase [Amycolatopsis sp. SID8362]|uniref:peptide deformylase n=1 Tax=Amycolatopsis sp. SID8362 TaxID=2690346 RepID=UPI0013696CED|nr:peptide deformylase [Amycolatopsis sp. SID8362]NBH03330.1 peptide deformylase [Amycolatopsis sp. SID8362]NED40031.1 peptide deformylase [Amycolatopsis sp. SID8362]